MSEYRDYSPHNRQPHDKIFQNSEMLKPEKRVTGKNYTTSYVQDEKYRHTTQSHVVRHNDQVPRTTSPYMRHSRQRDYLEDNPTLMAQHQQNTELTQPNEHYQSLVRNVSPSYTSNQLQVPQEKTKHAHRHRSPQNSQPAVVTHHIHSQDQYPVDQYNPTPQYQDVHQNNNYNNNNNNFNQNHNNNNNNNNNYTPQYYDDQNNNNNNNHNINNFYGDENYEDPTYQMQPKSKINNYDLPQKYDYNNRFDKRQNHFNAHELEQKYQKDEMHERLQDESYAVCNIF